MEKIVKTAQTNRARRLKIRLAVVLCLLGFGIAVGYAVGATHGGKAAVCHSVTEDANITDCDYRNGGWYTK
jgi:hypothetical protein